MSGARVCFFALVCLVFLVLVTTIVVSPCGKERDDVVKAPLPFGLHLEFLSERIMQMKHNCSSGWMLPYALLLSYALLLLQYWNTRNAWYLFFGAADRAEDQITYQYTLVISWCGLLFVIAFDHTSEFLLLHYAGVIVLIGTMYTLSAERDEHSTPSGRRIYHYVFMAFVVSAAVFGLLFVVDLQVGAVYLEYILLLDIFVASIINLSELHELSSPPSDEGMT
jgi:hypothetical protein